MSRPNLSRSMSQVKRNFAWREPVRPFISSTFVDFEEERDHLVRRIFPQLNSLCHSRGTYFAPVDLRWGINEEQAQSGHVISLCLDYISQCTPFFICLLGERYGSHRPNDSSPLPASYRDLPDDAPWLDVNFLRAAANGHKWVLQDAYQRSSITELEVIQAAFLNDSKYCRFYFRDVRHIEEKYQDLPRHEREEKLRPYLAENEDDELQVTELKERIAFRGLPVKYYLTIEELGLQVLDDWKAIINEVHPPLQCCISNVDSEHFREWAAHEAYAETRRRVFIQTNAIKELCEHLHQHGESAMEEEDTPQPEYMAYRKKKLHEEPKSILTIVGERGCGKSSILANWVKTFQKQHSDIKVIAHFVGSSSLSSDISSFLRRATYELRAEFAGTETDGCGDTEDLSDFHRICEAFVAAIGLGPCVLVLDGIDELGPTLGLDIYQVKQLPWLPDQIPKQCKFVISTVRSDFTHKCLSQREDTTIHTMPLFSSTKDKSKVITDMLAVHCKHLDQTQVDMVVDSKLSDRPLYLSILANELRVGGTYRNLSNLLQQYVSASSFRDLWRCVIDRWTKDYGWSLDGRSSVSSNSQLEDLSGWVSDILKLIACSRQGLSEAELRDILCMMGYSGSLKVTTFDFAMLRSATFDALFERPGGLMNFFHQHLRESVEFSLLGIISSTESESTSSINFLPPSGQHRIKRRCHEILAAYFWKQPASLRRTEELTYQLEKCGDIKGLFQIVTDPEVFLMMSGDRSQRIALRLDLVRYWQYLVQAGYHPSAYVDMVNKAAQQEEEMSTAKDATNDVLPQESTLDPTRVTGKRESVNASTSNARKLSAIDETIDRDRTADRGKQQGEQHITATEQSSECAVARLNESPSPATEGTKVQQEESVLDDGTMEGNIHQDENDREDTVPNGMEEDGDSLDGDSDDGSLYHEHQPEERCKLAILAMHAGKFLAERACFKESKRLLYLAIDNIGKKYPLSSPEQILLIQTQGSLADLHFYQLETVRALKCYQKALVTVENVAISEKDPLYQQLMEAKGRLLNRIGLMRGKDRLLRTGEHILLEARDCMRRANSIAGLATTQFYLGQLKIIKKDFEAGERCLREALQTRERWNGKCHPLVAEVLDELAGLLCNTNNIHRCDNDVAESMYRRALKIRERSFGGDHLLVATSLFHLGRLLRLNGSHQFKTEAVSLLKRALDIRTSKLGPNHTLTNAVRQMLKQVQHQLKVGDYDHAPVKQLDKRTTGNPKSSLSWHDQDLLKFERRSRSKSAKSQFGRVSSRGDRLHTRPTSSGSMSSWQSGERPRAQSAPIPADDDIEVGFQQDLHISHSEPSGITKGKEDLQMKTHSARSRKGLESRSALDMNWRKTVSHSASTRTTEYSKFTESRPATSFSRSRYGNDNLRSESRISQAVHHSQCDIPGEFELHPSNTKLVHGPHSQVHHLLGEPPCPRDLEAKLIHKAAWYHQPNRYPKNAYDEYPPRRHQVRPGNSHHGETL